MDLLTVFRLAFSITAILLLPGWAAISLFGIWRRWETLQRWILAIGISIAFFPIFFYMARLIPGLRIGPNKLLALFFVFAVNIAWQQRSTWKQQIRFDRLEWLALLVFAATMFTRVWIAIERPYPAWSDSLHHTLLTELTAESGRLPTTMEPYAPTPLDMYHLGLYSLTGPVQQLSGLPAHSALLWTAQILNGLCGLGVYLLLDRYSGRTGAVVGAITVGLISFQPSWYVNWGRFTQLASQTILLTAFAFTWDAVRSFAEAWDRSRPESAWLLFLAGALNAGGFLLHYRAAAFYFPLLVILCLYLLGMNLKAAGFGRTALSILSIGLIALFLIIIALISMFSAFSESVQPAYDLSPEEYQEAATPYFRTNFSTVFAIGLRRPLFTLSVVSLITLFVFRNRLGIMMALWVGAIVLIGNAYQLGIPILAFTNLGAGLMMLYMPSGVVIGASANEILNEKRIDEYQPMIRNAMLISFFIAGILGGIQRVREKEDFRYFLTDADVKAMEWIKQNTSEDALFAINSMMWVSQNPHGRDGGYWIPYFTERQTNAGTMHIGLGPEEYKEIKVLQSVAVIDFQNDPSQVSEMSIIGIDYFYTGPTSRFYSNGLESYELIGNPGLRLVFDSDGVAIFKIER